MEGYLNLRIQPWVRRIITRLIRNRARRYCYYYFWRRSDWKLLIFSQ
jgi:manganese transport protein